MRSFISKSIVLAALLVSASAAVAEQRRVVIAVPCGHLTEAQCTRFTALADEFVPAFFDAPVLKSDRARAGATCPRSDFDALERCYFDQIAARRQPVGDHLGLKNDEAALVVLLFDPRDFNGTIFGSSIVVARGGNPTLSSFSLSPTEIVAPNGKRSVYIVRGGELGAKAFEAGLRKTRPRNGPFATSPTSASYGDLAIDR